MKVRLATVFSGIGAIEQAFLRLGIDHEIVFACDNGNVPLDIDYESEITNIKQLNTPSEKQNYVAKLYAKSSRKNYVEMSYKANYQIPDDRFFNDIRLLDGNDFKNKVDLFVGGSPCQSFSQIGRQGGFEDTRGTLFYDYARLIKEIMPNIFVYENVRNVLRHDNGRTWQIMTRVFDELGYYWNYSVLDAKDYGIPQSRNRLIVVGFKNRAQFTKFAFPAKIPLVYDMHDFLFDNVKEGNFLSVGGKIELIPGGQNIPINKYFLSEKLKTYVLSPGTKKFMHPDAKIDLPIARAILSTQGNTHRASVNNYVTTNGMIRALAERESLRLMGFPDTFKIVVSKSQSYKQSGNSIVVDVLINLVLSIMKAVEE